jgi:alkylation response protein AidB-like acyl-CoA dehydrogenase
MTAPTEDSVRTELRAWLDDSWDPDLALVEWRGRLADSGWACPSWPAEWFGRGLPAALDDVVDAELARVGAPGTPPGAGMGLAAPTILIHGSDEQKAVLLRPTITGERTWCQLFSEPGSGSDLAGLTTRADLDGDEWTVNGQKVWNTSAHHAHLGMLLARTDWDVPKHKGISYLVLPMQQPGVEVRPLRQMNGRASFNEVFMTDARVPAADVIGDVGEGWPVALTTLAHERRLGLFRPPSFRGAAAGRAAEEAQAEAAEWFKVYEWYPQRAGRPDLVVPQAQANGRSRDAVVRQRAAALIAQQRAAQWTQDRARAARAQGRPPGAEGSIGKLSASHIARAAATAHSLVAGAEGMLTGPTTTPAGIVAEVLVSVPAVSIAGGTDEIQRNILGERVLGLPKEPQVDRDIPFRDVPRNTR